MKCLLPFLSLVSFCSLLSAQQDAVVFISVGRGLALNQYYNLWKPKPNTNIAVGYAVLPGFMLTGYVDFNSYAFQGEGSPHSTASYTLRSALVGAKVSANIRGSILSPYFIGAFGLSNASSTQDTVFQNYKGSLLVYHAIRGSTASGLAAAGSDIMIYKGLFGFVEIRGSGGFDSHVYDIIWMYRAGIGFDFH